MILTTNNTKDFNTLSNMIKATITFENLLQHICRSYFCK